MAKRKKSKSGNGAMMASPSSGGRSHLSVDISDAENGYIVNTSGSSNDGEYWSKKYIAKDKPDSLRIASSCLAGGSSKGGKKKASGKKKLSLKRG